MFSRRFAPRLLTVLALAVFAPGCGGGGDAGSQLTEFNLSTALTITPTQTTTIAANGQTMPLATNASSINVRVTVHPLAAVGSPPVSVSAPPQVSIWYMKDYVNFGWDDTRPVTSPAPPAGESVWQTTSELHWQGSQGTGLYMVLVKAKDPNGAEVIKPVGTFFFQNP